MKYELHDDYGMMFRRIVKHTCSYIDKNNIKTLVLGMSGGIDSTLIAALAREVADKCTIAVKLEGLILPIQSNNAEMGRAAIAAKTFCHHFELDNMTPAYTNLVRSIIPNTFPSTSIRRGNVKARLRMIRLYDMAQKMNGMVLSTDNYTEYLLGFWTLHGDVGDYGMIQNLWKTEVYGLSGYLLNKYKKEDELYKAAVLKECIKAMPTDGLGISGSDFDQIYPGYDRKGSPAQIYGNIDLILLKYLNGHISDKASNVIQRHKATEFKRLNPFSIPRESLIG